MHFAQLQPEKKSKGSIKALKQKFGKHCSKVLKKDFPPAIEKRPVMICPDNTVKIGKTILTSHD